MFKNKLTITGMGKLNYILVLSLILVVLNGQTTPNSKPVGILHLLFKPSEKLIHHSPEPFFLNRLIELELFIDFPKDSLETISIFIKTDQMDQFQEQPLVEKRGIHIFKLNQKAYPGITVEYFYYVKTYSQGSYAYPLNDKGEISPISQRFIDPVKYYKWKKILNR
ncbi:MAG: hypothetical protein HOK52_07790 [Candidatus Marinimicrobia bacterium]|jgi:hypothetical protein|nr:hypothetical protein [Candidatus Neomarinimicrobiota bacterium]MBT3936830.1 hypothetical protein [Candidatus Neomarinimicrobiota bacterium]MBT3961975.1 hypothetical protein [Candidatus Neomarinimicrobiota bacterium]MBT4383665.1 hypothetical protein [Candidatus Neomarinimicrobiota bacterium]MBT4635828.1 hypothetical protein [Candidatus Neomarinimicrobiota bacterium]